MRHRGRTGGYQWSYHTKDFLRGMADHRWMGVSPDGCRRYHRFDDEVHTRARRCLLASASCHLGRVHPGRATSLEMVRSTKVPAFYNHWICYFWHRAGVPKGGHKPPRDPSTVMVWPRAARAAVRRTAKATWSKPSWDPRAGPCVPEPPSRRKDPVSMFLMRCMQNSARFSIFYGDEMP